MRVEILSRVLAAVFAFFVPVVAFLLPRSPSGVFLAFDRVTAYALFAIMGICAILVLFDVIRNYVLRRRCWAWITNKREWVYLTIAFCTLLSQFTAARFAIVETPIVLVFLLIFTGQFLQALRDAQEGFARAENCSLR